MNSRPEMSDSLSLKIKAEARRLGFDLVGIAPAVTPPGFPNFLQWLENGYAGDMTYLSRRREAYESPDHVLPDVRSIVMLAISYHDPVSSRMPADGPVASTTIRGRISSYASGTNDYHDVLRDKLSRLSEFVRAQLPGTRSRGIVDTAPLLERDFARLAGLGWFGKNTMLLNRQAGSWFFLAALLVDCELDYDEPHATSHCGTCTRCLDACPTDAFAEPYVLDARRCISYLTIELRDQIPLELRDGMGDWLFGCDICQDVCPWNRKAFAGRDPAFANSSHSASVDAVSLLTLTETEFQERFGSTPLARSRRAGLLRNACVVLGNSEKQNAIPQLTEALLDDESLVRGAAAWALGKIGGATALAALANRQSIEEDPDVQQELALALQRNSVKNV